MKRLSMMALILAVWCSSLGNTVFATPPENIVGSGEWKSLSSDAIGGTWSVRLTRTGRHVRGEIALTGSTEFSGGSVDGSMDDESIMLGVVEQGTKQATFSGRLAGPTLSGEWSSALVKDHGVWYGTLAE